MKTISTWIWWSGSEQGPIHQCNISVITMNLAKYLFCHRLRRMFKTLFCFFHFLLFFSFQFDRIRCSVFAFNCYVICIMVNLFCHRSICMYVVGSCMFLVCFYSFMIRFLFDFNFEFATNHQHRNSIFNENISTEEMVLALHRASINKCNCSLDFIYQVFVLSADVRHALAMFICCSVNYLYVSIFLSASASSSHFSFLILFIIYFVVDVEQYGSIAYN